VSDLLMCAGFELKENIRNRWIFAYFSFFLILSGLLLYFGGNENGKTAASLLNAVLLLIPLFSLLFGAMNFSDSLPFMEVIFVRPISRRDYFIGKWLGLSFALNIGYFFGAGIPMLIFMSDGKFLFLSFQLLMYGCLLNMSFTAVSFFIAIIFLKREAVLSAALSVWFFFYLFYDFLMLGISIHFGEYPLEIPILVLTALNPLDLVRIVTILQMDNAVLLGFTSAFYQKYLGFTGGISLCLLFLSLWTVFPVYFSLRLFRKRDL